MTTAAPAEKMMLDADWRALKKYGSHFKSCPAFADDDKTCNCGYRDALSKAARRLAPRVGDEGVTPELRRAWLERLLAEAVQWVELDSDQPLGGKKLTWLKLARSATKHLRPALSAPPAASADERFAALMQLLDDIEAWTTLHHKTISERSLAESLYKDGYRKHQGVVLPAVHCDVCGERPDRGGCGFKRDDCPDWNSEAAPRLSALPKGQEHEG